MPAAAGIGEADSHDQLARALPGPQDQRARGPRGADLSRPAGVLDAAATQALGGRFGRRAKALGAHGREGSQSCEPAVAPCGLEPVDERQAEQALSVEWIGIRIRLPHGGDRGRPLLRHDRVGLRGRVHEGRLRGPFNRLAQARDRIDLAFLSRHAGNVGPGGARLYARV